MISRVNEVMEFVGRFIEIYETTYSHFTPTFANILFHSRNVRDGWADQLPQSQPEWTDCAYPALASSLHHCLRIIFFFIFFLSFFILTCQIFNSQFWPNNLLKDHKENLVWAIRPLVKILFGYWKVVAATWKFTVIISLWYFQRYVIF